MKSASLPAKVVVLLLLSITVVMLAVTTISYIARRAMLFEERNLQCAVAVERISKTLAVPLWNLDFDQLHNITKEELKAAGFSRLTVMGANGEILVDESIPDIHKNWLEVKSDSRYIVWRDIIWQENKRLGAVGLSFDNGVVASKLTIFLLWSVLQGIALIICTCAALYFGLSRILLQPLRPILIAAEQFAGGSLSNRIPVTSQDELGRLATSFNQMAAAIEERIAQLKEAETKYRRLFETIQDVFYRTDNDGTLILVSPSFSTVLGYDSSDILGRKAKDFLVDNDSSSHFLELLERTGHTEDTLVTLRKADNSLLTVSTSSHYYYDDNGNRLGVEGLFRDVTERMDAFWEIERLKDSLTAVINSLPSLILTADRDGIVDLWNNSAEKSTGVSASQAHGAMMETLLPQFAELVPEVQRVVDRQHSRRIDKYMVFEQGEQHFYEIMITPCSRVGSVGAVIRIDDITEKIRVSEVMIQTEKMMMIGGLAAGMAHEINNPLGAIMQSAQNIVRRVSPEIPANHDAAHTLGIELESVRAYMESRGILGFIEHIRESGTRAARIITSMMKFSRKSESRVELAKLADIIDQTIELAANDYDLKKKFDFRHIEIIKEFEPDLPPVPITVLEIEQVLLNIIKNAAQAMAASTMAHSPRLTFRLRHEGEFAIIEIADNGPGMDQATQSRVFEPFFTTKEVGVGTGLGLSVSYTIITTNHHGSLKVRSTRGEGACFTITLPLRGN